jgi:hypothetical protein
MTGSKLYGMPISWRMTTLASILQLQQRLREGFDWVPIFQNVGTGEVPVTVTCFKYTEDGHSICDLCSIYTI